MKILLLTAYFPPDTGSAAHLFFELGSELVARGHHVFVITNKPGYHAQGSLDQYKKKILIQETINGINVYRVPSLRLPPRLMIGRALWQFNTAFFFFLAGLFVTRPDIVLVYSPPLTLGLSAWGLRIFRKIPFVLNIQDLFPKSIVDLGLLKNQKIINWFERMERFLYGRADIVTAHSSGNKKHILTHGGLYERVEVLPNWVDTTFIRPGNKQNEFYYSNELAGKFVLSFAGVLGYSQDLDVIIDAANQLRNYQDIRWMIVGDGVEKDRLIQRVRDLDLEQSVLFVPMVPREKYPEVLDVSDVGLATLHADVNTPVVPSKILSIMAAGKPVISAMNLDGDAPRLIKEAECGISLPPGDSQAFATAAKKLYQDLSLCNEMGKKGRQYAEKFLSLDSCASNYEDLFKRLI